MIDFNRLTAIAISTTKSFNKPELTDDFIQFAAEALLRGRKATVKQLFIDFIRQELGDSRAKTDRRDEFKFCNSVEWEEYMDTAVVDTHDVDFTNIVNEFEGTSRTILVLYYVWGMTLKEIGYSLGVTESAISLRFTDLSKKLIKRYRNNQ